LNKSDVAPLELKYILWILKILIFRAAGAFKVANVNAGQATGAPRVNA